MKILNYLLNFGKFVSAIVSSLSYSSIPTYVLLLAIYILLNLFSRLEVNYNPGS